MCTSDLVKGGEEMRTTVQTTIDLEKHIRVPPRHNTPTFVVDAPAAVASATHAAENYNRDTGIGVCSPFREARSIVPLF